MTGAAWRLGARDRRRLAIGAVTGGALLGAGAALPWLTFFAGLHRLSGLTGLHGRSLLAAGALCALAGLVLGVRDSRAARGLLLALGAAALLLTLWVIAGLRETLQALAREQPMLVAQPGYGVALCVAGALLVTVAAWPRRQVAEAR